MNVGMSSVCTYLAIHLHVYASLHVNLDKTACIHERETAYMLLWCCDVGRAHI